MSEPIVNHLKVCPIPGEKDRYFVGSRSRPEMDHVVDLRYQEDEDDVTHAECFCEAFHANRYTKGNTCPHLQAVFDYCRQHGLEIPK